MCPGDDAHWLPLIVYERLDSVVLLDGRNMHYVLGLTDTYWDEDLADTFRDEDLEDAQDRERSRSPRRDCAGLLRRLEEGCGRASVEAAVVDMGPGHWQEAFRVLHPE